VEGATIGSCSSRKVIANERLLMALSKSCKILQISPDCWPATGGVAEYAGRLSMEFVRAGHQVTVLSLPDKGLPQEEVRNDVVILRPWWMSWDRNRENMNALRYSLRRLRHIHTQCRWVTELVETQKPDAILFTQSYPHVAKGLGDRGTKYSQILHGNETLAIMNQPNLILRLIQTQRFRKAIASASYVYTNSRYSAGLVERLTGRRNGLVPIFCGVDASLLDRVIDKSQARMAMSLPQDRPIILSVGRLIYRKGFDLALLAVQQVKSTIPDVLYVVVGAGPCEPELRAMVDMMGLQKNVRFAGLVTDPKILGNYYSACDVFVMASRETRHNVETFGIVYLEANAFGKPVVAGDTGGVSDAVEDGMNGFLCRPEDGDEIAERIVRLIQNPQLSAEMGQRGRERIITKFNWRRIASDILESMMPSGDPGVI
jgi:glycosyltransferase involved in cell wall biosynthesis